MKESRLDQPCADKCLGECCARCSVNGREHSERSEGELLGRYWRDLMLKETRLDTASPTGVEGLSLRGNKGCEGYGYVVGIKGGSDFS